MPTSAASSTSSTRWPSRCLSSPARRSPDGYVSMTDDTAGERPRAGLSRRGLLGLAGGGVAALAAAGGGGFALGAVQPQGQPASGTHAFFGSRQAGIVTPV